MMNELKTELRTMNQWETELRLKFPGKLFKRKAGFCFEWQAFLIAYDVFDLKPEEFLKLDQNIQITALAYGAAVWFCVRRRKKVFFTHNDIARALDKASKEENKRLGEALKCAQFPEWFQAYKKR